MSGHYALLRWNPSLVALPGFPADWRAHWNTSPANQALMVHEDADARRVDLACWGLTPAWLTDPSYTPDHARTEIPAGQPMLHEVFQQRYRLLPANGLYEWRGMRKRPYWASAGERLLFSAGIQKVYPMQGQTWLSVTQVSQAVAEFRRPLLFDKAEQDIWLAPDTSLPALINLLAKPQPNLHSVTLVGFVSKFETDGPECLTPT